MASYPPLDRGIVLLNGKVFDPWAPDMAVVDHVVLCRTLARMPRWCAQTEVFYSVAQHSCLVHDVVPDGMKLPAILHDAHEALTGFGDIPSPIKQRCQMVGMLEQNIDRAVAQHYKFDYAAFSHAHIQIADMVVLATEIRDVMPVNEYPFPNLPDPLEKEIEPWSQETAEQQMLARLAATTTRAELNIGTLL